MAALALAVSVSVIAATPAFAAFDATFDPGDWILGVQNSTAAANVLEVNLGAALQYKNAFNSNANILNIGNINAELTTLGGAAWYDNANLFFGVQGARTSTAAAGSADANGDFNSTLYVSNARAGGGTAGSANSSAWAIAASSVSTAAAGMIQVGNTFTGTPPPGTAVKLIPTSQPNDWSDLNPVAGVTQGTAYGAFVGGIQYRFDTGLFDDGTFAGLSGIEAVVDMYRIARFTNGGSTPGQGTYIGSFAIEHDGDVHFIATPIPEVNSAMLLGLVPLAGLCLRRRHAVLA